MNDGSESHRSAGVASLASPLFPHHCDRFPMPQKTHRGTRRRPSQLESPTPLTNLKVEPTTYWGCPLQTRESPNFNSLQVSFRQQHWHSWQNDVAWTWSHS